MQGVKNGVRQLIAFLSQNPNPTRVIICDYFKGQSIGFPESTAPPFSMLEDN